MSLLEDGCIYAMKNDFVSVIRLISIDPNVLKAKDPTGKSLTHWASVYKNKLYFQSCLESDFIFNSKYKNILFKLLNIGIKNRLIDVDAIKKIPDEVVLNQNKNTLIHMSVYLNDKELYDYLSSVQNKDMLDDFLTGKLGYKLMENIIKYGKVTSFMEINKYIKTHDRIDYTNKINNIKTNSFYKTSLPIKYIIRNLNRVNQPCF